MRRDPRLVPLSQDHHRGLVIARHLQRAAGRDAIARLAALVEFREAWTDLEEHFAEEERLVDRVLAPADPDRRRLEEDHDALRAASVLAERLLAEPHPGPEEVRAIGERLADHIRWEERELFPRLEGIPARTGPGSVSR